MGRVGEVITRTWQTADKMKLFRGQLPDEKVGFVMFEPDHEILVLFAYY